MARRLSRTARTAALVRHDPGRVCETLVEIYRRIVDDAGPATLGDGGRPERTWTGYQGHGIWVARAARSGERALAAVDGLSTR
jgi:hypothetical protein